MEQPRDPVRLKSVLNLVDESNLALASCVPLHSRNQQPAGAEAKIPLWDSIGIMDADCATCERKPLHIE